MPIHEAVQSIISAGEISGYPNIRIALELLLSNAVAASSPWNFGSTPNRFENSVAIQRT
jgi:hypothetical protein